MLNENKIKMMTKMAIYEKNEGRDMKRIARYYMGDYIAFSVLKSLIATSIAFVIVIVLALITNMEAIIKNVNSMDYATFAKTIVTYYVIALVVFGIISGIYGAFQYVNGKKGLRQYMSRINKLERFYDGNRRKKR